MARGELDAGYFLYKDEVKYITLDMCTCGDMLSETECGECVFKYAYIIGVTIIDVHVKISQYYIVCCSWQQGNEMVSDVIDEHSVCYCIFRGGW